MKVCKDAKTGKTPRLVVRGVYSQKSTEVGVHWLRISFPDKYLQEVKETISRFFGSKPNERFGLWGYDNSYRWNNGAMIIFDVDYEKACFHHHRAYFECPGRACDDLTPADLSLLMEIFKDGFYGKGERIDIFLDDFERRIDPHGIQKIVKLKDYSRFRQFHLKQSYDKGNELVYDAIVFGSHKKGWEKQLEVYDKNLESKGERNCVRWEAKFREVKADSIFKKLAGTCGNLDAFALLCGSIVVGSITFIRRNGDKNIPRLDEYEFWKLIKDGLADLRIRSEKKINTVYGIMEWVKRQVAPNFACLSKVFKSEKVFFSWLLDLLRDGEGRLNANQRSIIDQFSEFFDHRSFIDPFELENRYLNDMCNIF